MPITRTAMVDDDGSGTTGTVINNAWKQELYDQIDGYAASRIVQTTTLTGVQNNFPLTPGCSVLRCNNSAGILTITGMSAGVDGQEVTIHEVAAAEVDLTFADAGSTAANRLINYASSGPTMLSGAGAVEGGHARYRYDAGTSIWRLVGHDQGSWLDVSYSAANFSTTGGGTWTVDGADQVTFCYLLQGRTLKIALYVDNSSMSTAGVNVLQVAIPRGFTAAYTVQNGTLLFDNNAPVNGFVRAIKNASVLQIGRNDSGNFAAATNTTFVRALIDVPIN